MGLTDKIALVAAGSKGMGRAVALGLAAEGAAVTISARGQEALSSTVEEIRALGVPALGICADVSTAEGVQDMIRKTVGRFGALDILVVNAGGPPSLSFEKAGDADWSSAFELTLMSAVRLIRWALPHLEQRRGSVVTIESISVKQPIRELILSNVIRPGVVALTKTLSDELGPAGVRFNNILPGMILTDRSRELAEARAIRTGSPMVDVLEETAASIPLRRYGDPAEVANLAVFLASDAASYITGTTITCDGGLFRGLM